MPNNSDPISANMLEGESTLIAARLVEEPIALRLF